MSTALYSKTDDFKFKVVMFTEIDSNVSDKVNKNVAITQLIRYARIRGKLKDFVVVGKSLLKTYLNRGLNSNLLRVIMSKTFGNNTLIFSKFLFPCETNFNRFRHLLVIA